MVSGSVNIFLMLYLKYNIIVCSFSGERKKFNSKILILGKLSFILPVIISFNNSILTSDICENIKLLHYKKHAGCNNNGIFRRRRITTLS